LKKINVDDKLIEAYSEVLDFQDFNTGSLIKNIEVRLDCLEGAMKLLLKLLLGTLKIFSIVFIKRKNFYKTIIIRLDFIFPISLLNKLFISYLLLDFYE
tara:strand:+ start:58 stop:354 length:297 start_codon:yes stop_codon:yes gene_type:complete